MRILAAIGLLAIIAAVVAGVFLLGGYYDVSAQGEDSPIVKTVLMEARSRAVRHAAADQPPGDFATPDRIETGAKAFSERGCVNCHGGPGVSWAKFSEGLNPGPPDLKDVAPDLKPQEIFWVVKHGIRMTGMPSFAAAGVPDEEIWSIAAFVKALPKVSDDDFKAWSVGGASAQPKP
jgi:mono/diheme cytochrome c family protein